MKFIYVLLISFLINTVSLSNDVKNSGESLSLNGQWEMGYDRAYTQTVNVPGIHSDPTVIRNEPTWYRKKVHLPNGDWNQVSLLLKGARFTPQVWINNKQVAQREGGMGPIRFDLNHSDLLPGKTVTIEIRLASLKEVPETDASYIPVADHWRSNVSSSLWDDVELQFYNNIKISRVIPFYDREKDQSEIKFEVKGKRQSISVKAEILDKDNQVVQVGETTLKESKGSLKIDHKGKLKAWSVDDPNLYTLRLTAFKKNKILDKCEMNFGLKTFEIHKKKFYLNDEPFTPLGVTVVWPRWMRTEEGRALGYNEEWFYENIIKRTKDLGGNYLRYHLGLPPEKFLDLCDQHGLVVQYEWSFFHGMPASEESLLIQYKDWLDLAMKHPSVALVHPYNETHEEELDIAWSALNKLLPEYPPLVLEDRDVIHIHKYWWSLFENLGLYYDDADQFPKAIMVDEFGGNYLDGNGDFGEYATVQETYLRFLGRENDATSRLAFHSDANVKVAEYWRRIGAAGVSPFCALGSKKDGSHWFLGELKDGIPKPVWNDLAVVFSPVSISLDLWDQNFVPNQTINLPIHLFNDLKEERELNVQVSLVNNDGKLIIKNHFKERLEGYSKKIKNVALTLPENIGKYDIKVELKNKPDFVKHPVVSKWSINVLKATSKSKLVVGVYEVDKELKEMLEKNNIEVVDVKNKNADLVLTGLETWKEIANGNQKIVSRLDKVISSGTSVVMLDIGDKWLGQGYPKNEGELGPLQGAAQVKNGTQKSYKLFKGVTMEFKEIAEPESHIHAAKNNNQLWSHLEKDQTWLWNGYRGGLIVPATEMRFYGLSASAFLADWIAKGADQEAIKNGEYYAYHLEGFYAYSNTSNDVGVKKQLRKKLKFLMDDAPALAKSLNKNARVEIVNLSTAYQKSKEGEAKSFMPLVSCGKNLTKTPVASIQFGEGNGKLIVSQLLTAGRLADGYGEKTPYGVRYDEAAVQFVINMIEQATNQTIYE